MRDAEADERLRRADDADARPQPRLRPEDRLAGRARRAFPTSSSSPSTRTSTDIVDRVAAGELDDENAASLPPQALEQYSHGPGQAASTCTSTPATGTSYLTMNLTQPPFDDIHVRRAMNWIMDKAALRAGLGRPERSARSRTTSSRTRSSTTSSPSTPRTRRPGDHGSLAKAKAAMKGSKYDTKHDGTCSASACQNVLLLTDTQAVVHEDAPGRRRPAAKIGITFHVRDDRRRVPDAPDDGEEHPDRRSSPGWGKDYADPLTFF